MTRRTLAFSLFAKPAKHIVFLTGDGEYRSEVTMPVIAKEMEAEYGVRTSMAGSRTDTDMVGLEALKTADCAVFFLRWRTLPEEQLRLILEYVESGRPVVGFRTATHSFRYPKGSAHEDLNEAFPYRVFGAKWTRHHGKESTTKTELAAGRKRHPILKGVEPEMVLRSWLYSVVPLAEGSEPLLIGRTVNPQGGRDDGPQPVAWTRKHKGARVFFTTLGHPEDFADRSMRRMAKNGIAWAAGMGR